MKYFFLTEGWKIARVWDTSGIWNEQVQRRKPGIERIEMGIVENGEAFWLYRVEEAVVMVEVKPFPSDGSAKGFGQVVLKRLIDAQEVLDRLCTAEALFNSTTAIPPLTLPGEANIRVP
ncbi:hypothetical protein [Gloeobacter kilaueensis]|uniref:Uncharacterized protein n=1 Tax=Gloeobacter kilaueensis (strain ATCC BAA-2537 / CCAP 1431/1 / ULC 316 / JS1) TaxID=1183438 RepID=U5QL80_GLOK1|nr:hypothetical protein [Gloeobacter kilaueensis]AGY59643.1 hypothetical protein GKIL_3397 [Gloeobacter kilaueensis JS1]